MSEIPDFTDSEKWVVETTLRERYREPVQIELAEAEMRLNPLSTQLTPCPVIFWQRDGCNFVVFKVGEGRYRAQFFYRVHKQYGTGIETFEDITECVVTLLQVQADYLVNEHEE